MPWPGLGTWSSSAAVRRPEECIRRDRRSTQPGRCRCQHGRAPSWAPHRTARCVRCSDPRTAGRCTSAARSPASARPAEPTWRRSRSRTERPRRSGSPRRTAGCVRCGCIAGLPVRGRHVLEDRLRQPRRRCRSGSHHGCAEGVEPQHGLGHLRDRSGSGWLGDLRRRAVQPDRAASLCPIWPRSVSPPVALTSWTSANRCNDSNRCHGLRPGARTAAPCLSRRVARVGVSTH